MADLELSAEAQWVEEPDPMPDYSEASLIIVNGAYAQISVDRTAARVA